MAQITIVGLGQIGASIGLALGDQKSALKRVGHDKKLDVERAARDKGAVDETQHNLPSAVREANLVMLCLPVSQVRETLEFIEEDLREGAIVMDTSPVKSAVIDWARELLPAGRYYVGLVPALNPDLLHEHGFGVEAARADLFKNGLMVIDAPPGTPAEVVELASGLTRLLGAAPLLADAAESDGLMAGVHLLPQLAAAAFLNATVDQPGWQESRKLAGRPFASVTAALAYQDDIDALRAAALQNRENTVRAMDIFLAAMRGLRDDISNEDDEGVALRLEQALDGRNRWWRERMAADWQAESQVPMDVPTFVERFLGTAFIRKSQG
ncbi:MAG TPA: prephenate dehydrogenase/arogenate dehydrogenase family protein [Anaerolineales bacterium]|jgi:prephenate dehydrogenase